MKKQCANKCQAVHGKTGFWYYEINGPDSKWVKCELCSPNSSAGAEPIKLRSANVAVKPESNLGRTGGSIPPTGDTSPESQENPAQPNDGAGRGHGIWPSLELENQMLCDAEHLIRTSTSMSVDRDCAVHIKALLARVRDLEADRDKVHPELLSECVPPSLGDENAAFYDGVS